MFGEHNVTCHNKGMSYFYLGKLKEAKECFERSVELDEVCAGRQEGLQYKFPLFFLVDIASRLLKIHSILLVPPALPCHRRV